MSVFGGLTFGGGPVANYMSHAIAAMVDALRARGRCGLLFGNGGWVTTNHAVLVSRDPDLALLAPEDFDVNAAADLLRGPAPDTIEHFDGEAEIETYTVFYRRDGTPKHGVIVALTPGNQRFLAHVPGEDAAAIAFLTDGAREPVGAGIRAAAGANGMIAARIA
jgi:acetyl-CoA C-acetyltransferase